MSEENCEQKQAGGDGGSQSPQPPMSPRTHIDKFLLPSSPIPYRRVRTVSMSERINKTALHKGKVEVFCRDRGHGFIKPDDGGDHLFVHISDIDGEYLLKAGDGVSFKKLLIPPKNENIDGEYVPEAGDGVSFKKLLIPPKNEKYMAVHVTITHPVDGVRHKTWESSKPQTSEQGTPGS